MVLKIKRIFMALYHTILNAIGKMLAGKKKGIWLFAERGFDARDNAYHLYNWVNKNRHEITAYYVINKKDADYGRIRGKTVRRGSLRHYILMYEAEALISTHSFGWTPNMIVYNRLYQAGLFKPSGKIVFLQHGVLDKDIEFLYRKNFTPDIFVVSTVKEMNYVLETCQQPKNVVVLTGLCRFDNLDNYKTDDSVILFMPTWRSWLQYESEESFLKSDYYKAINAFLTSERLSEYLRKNNKRLLFYPHIEMQKFLKDFKSCEEVEILGARTADVQELLKQASMLITDYSSVYFDMLYMHKPVVFYQWDKEKYATQHYQGFIEKHEDYGPVAENIDELMDIVEKTADAERDMMAPTPFVYIDKNNCKRVFSRIEEKINE